ncbi:MAG: class I SAM-dependent methyltransferase [Gemmatimonadetes bacterium]|jgi:SAM-dependent methyltransferase|nr:class I SAM-dependent methyltransferase [Gemmatimonadota bacterium]
MELDQDRLRSILDAEHSFYGSRPVEYRYDGRLNPGTRDLIASQFRPEMRVLDIGCGNGATLLENSHLFASGLGIDYDPAHIILAEDGLREKNAANVEFRQLDFLQDIKELEPESFDFVFSERGLSAYNSFGIQAALRVLRPDGLLFCELIGDLHHQEVNEVFSVGPRLNQIIRTLEQVQVAMERNGVEIRLAANIVSKRYYPDIYEWLQFQCSIWVWSGGSLPSPDDARWALFAERNTTPSGEIETTHHVVWVGGVKLTDGSHYAEFKHFGQ